MELMVSGIADEGTTEADLCVQQLAPARLSSNRAMSRGLSTLKMAYHG